MTLGFTGMGESGCGAIEEAGPPVKELRSPGKYAYCLGEWHKDMMNELESEQADV